MAPDPIVLVGDGAAGIAAIEAIRRQGCRGPITLVGDDPHPAYFRAALTTYLHGRLTTERLFATRAGFYAEHGVTRVSGRATRLDRAARSLIYTVGEREHALRYERLVVCSGARPRTLDGAEVVPGVSTLRDLAEARALRDALVPPGGGRSLVRNAAVVGGGPLGLELLWALRRHGVACTLLLRRRRILEVELDPKASDLVLGRLEQAGVRVVVTGSLAPRVAARAGGGVELRVGGAEPSGFDRVLVAIGVVPNADWLSGSGVVVTPAGVPVDAGMRVRLEDGSHAPDVFAAGDVTASSGPRLWAPARAQGAVAGSNAAGGAAQVDAWTSPFTTRLFDLDVAVGGTRPAGDGPGGDGPGIVRSTEADADGVTYRRVDLEASGGAWRVRGYMLLGPPGARAHSAALHELMRGGVDVGAIRERLASRAFDLTRWVEARRPPEALDAGSEGRADTVVARLVGGGGPARGGVLFGVLRDCASGSEHTFPQRAVVGRGPGADVDLTPDDTVSRAHAEVYRDGAGWWVSNRSATNPLEVERAGARTSLAPGKGMPIGSGDVLRLGNAELRFSERSAPPLRLGDRTIEGGRAVLDGGAEGVRRPLALLTEEDGVWFLRALGTGDVRVNGAPVSGVVAVRDGDDLDLGGVPSRVTLGAALARVERARTNAPEGASSAASSPARPARPGWRLVDPAGRRIEVPHPGMLGRDPRVVHFAVDHPTVSGHHLDVKPTARGLVLVNRGRATTLNGAPVAPGASCTVGAGDVVVVGDVALRVEGGP